jgi:hypothetical protein
VLVFGGRIANAKYVWTDATDLAWLYDPVADTWTKAPGLPFARDRHTVSRLADARLLLVSGNGWPDGDAASAVCDPATGSWSVAAALSERRQLHAAALLGDGRVVVAGGAARDGGLGDRDRDGHAWRRRALAEEE